MSERIERLLLRCRGENRAAFIPYICAGDPNFARTVEIALALERSGADLLELGLRHFPIRWRMALSTNWRRNARSKPEQLRTACSIVCARFGVLPRSRLCFYTYLNPIFRFGIEKFNQAAADAGVDGLLILDLPPEEDANAQKLDGLKPSSLRNENDNNAAKIVRVRLIAPTTPPERIALIAKAAARIYLLCLARRRDGAREIRSRKRSKRNSHSFASTRICQSRLVLGFRIQSRLLRLLVWPTRSWSEARLSI